MNRLIFTATIFTLCFGSATARADQSDFPAITINSIQGQICFDEWCGYPDFFVIVRLRNALGQEIQCPASPVSTDQIAPTPNVTLCNPPGTLTPIKIRRPYSVIVEVWDADGFPVPGGSVPGTNVAEQADLSNGPEKQAKVGPFNSAVASTTHFAVQGPGAWIDFDVATTPMPTTFTGGPSLSRFDIDPSIGESVLISAVLDDPTKLQIQATNVSTGDTTAIPTPAASNVLNVAWNGTRMGGGLMPNGIYQIDITGAGLSSSLTLALAPRALLTFGVPEMETPEALNVHAIAPRIAVSLPEPTDVDVEVRGRGCSGPVLRQMTFPALPIGRNRLSWDGQLSGGAWAGPGSYCLSLIGHRSSDHASYHAMPPFAVRVLPQNPMRVDVRMSPEVPALSTGVPLRVVGRIFDEHGVPRPAKFIYLSAGDFAAPNSMMSPVGPPCTEASECSILFPAGSVFATAMISAQAEDANGELITFSPIRLVDLVQPAPGTDIRVSVATSWDGRRIVEKPRMRSIDIVFQRSIDFSNDDPTAIAFPAVLGRHMDEILGYNSPRHGPSIQEENIDSTSFWAVSGLAVVEHGWSPLDPAADRCRVVSSNPSNNLNINVNAVLHLIDCRDNAHSTYYTAQAGRGDISWHELHHTPFELADEYCCDGGYFMTAIFPNMYPTLGDCTTYSSNPATCRQLSGTIANVPTILPWFASDPGSHDVMVDDGVQNADDARKVRARYLTCMAGGC